MPSSAAPAHPRGPEGRAFTDRVIKVQGAHRQVTVALSYPKPDDIVDWTSDGSYVASGYAIFLSVKYDYKGHFWQGDFGKVGIDATVLARQPSSSPWTDLNSLLMALRERWATHTKAVAQAQSPPDFEQWLEPRISQLNGAPCVQQHIAQGSHPNEERHFYFVVDENHALDLSVYLVDNSTRPGLPESDWRPRAEAFASKILSMIQVQ